MVSEIPNVYIHLSFRSFRGRVSQHKCCSLWSEEKAKFNYKPINWNSGLYMSG